MSNAITLAPMNPKVRVEFQNIAGYLVDMFINERYNRAESLYKNSKKINSVTEGYYMAIQEYIQLLETDSRTYISTLEGIIGYYRKWTEHKTLTLTSGIDHILQNFVPIKYFYSIKDDLREAVTQQIIRNIVKRTAQVVLEKYTRHIIDGRKKSMRDTIYILRDEVEKILQMERDEYFTRFALGQEEIKVNDSATTEKAKLAKTIALAQQFLNQRKAVEEKLKKAVNYINALRARVAELQKELGQKNSTLKSRDAEIDDLNTKLEETYEQLAQSQAGDEEYENLTDAQNFDPARMFESRQEQQPDPLLVPPKNIPDDKPGGGDIDLSAIDV